MHHTHSSLPLPNMQNELSRRRFVEGLAATTAGLALLGCHSKGASVSSTVVKNADGSMTVTGAGSLTPGEFVSFTLPNGDPGVVFMSALGVHGAVDAKCTHAGCTVKFEPSSGTSEVFHCPCHDSVFSLTGAVKNGPARRPLTAYTVTVSGDDAVLRAA